MSLCVLPCEFFPLSNTLFISVVLSAKYTVSVENLMWMRARVGAQVKIVRTTKWRRFFVRPWIIAINACNHELVCWIVTFCFWILFYCCCATRKAKGLLTLICMRSPVCQVKIATTPNWKVIFLYDTNARFMHPSTRTLMSRCVLNDEFLFSWQLCYRAVWRTCCARSRVGAPRKDNCTGCDVSTRV